jgi:hypothetical protein
MISLQQVKNDLSESICEPCMDGGSDTANSTPKGVFLAEGASQGS